MILTPLPAWNFSLCSLDSSWPQEVVSVCVLYEALLRNVSIVLQCSVIFHAFSYSVTLWKACGLLQDLTDTIACLSISRFSKVACLIHNKWWLFTFVRLMWLNISIWNESILALPHCLFGWFSIPHESGRMAKSESKMAYANCHHNQCACYEVITMVWHCCCIFQVTVLNYFSIMYDRILRWFGFH